MSEDTLGTSAAPGGKPIDFSGFDFDVETVSPEEVVRAVDQKEVMSSLSRAGIRLQATAPTGKFQTYPMGTSGQLQAAIGMAQGSSHVAVAKDGTTGKFKLLVSVPEREPDQGFVPDIVTEE